MTLRKPVWGEIGWIDLTSTHAPQLKEFYAQVVGWQSEDIPMGEYQDYVMQTSQEQQPVAGICHAIGQNADLPPGWLIYISIPQLEPAIEAVKRLGGKVLVQPRSLGGMGRFCVIQDPAGSASALFEPAV